MAGIQLFTWEELNEKTWDNISNYLWYEESGNYLFLVRSEGLLYTVVDGELSRLPATEVTSLLFEQYGIDTKPTWSIIGSLVNPELLRWSSEHLGTEFARMVAIPIQKTVFTDVYNVFDMTALGIERMIAVCSDDCTFAISFDAGAKWKVITPFGWGEISLGDTGMNPTTLASITQEQWSIGLAETGGFMVRVTIPTETSYLTSVHTDLIL